MKLALVGKPETPTRFQNGTRRPFNPFYTSEAGAESRRPFFFQSCDRLPWRGKEKAIDSFEVAHKTFCRDDGFDSIDRRSMALGRQAGALFAVKPFDRHIPVVNHV
jgi:hypothetical protein